MIRRMIVLTFATLAFSLMTADAAFAQPQCEIRVSGDLYDALNNHVWETNNDTYEVGYTTVQSQCVEYVQGSLNWYTYSVCEARSSGVTFDYEADAYFQGNYVQTVYADESECAHWGLNVYTVLNTNDPLSPDESVFSPDGYLELIYQLDGNLVLYFWDYPVWASGTFGTPGQAVVQSDGNFVVYDNSSQPEWASNTSGSGAFLAVRNGGPLVLYDSSGNVLWVQAW